MADCYESERFYLYEIRIRQIIFDESTEVTIFGSVPDDDEYENSIGFDFLCSFGLLTDILLFADEKDKNGNWQLTKDNCYFIETAEEKDKFFEREGDDFPFKEHRQSAGEDLLTEALNNLQDIETEEQQLSEYMLILNSAYNHYLQLLSKDFSEKEARKRSGLTDELLFRIAVLNNKIFNK